MSEHQGSLTALRRGNRGTLLALLRTNGAMHRAELARRIGVSRTTVSTIVNELLDEQLIVEVEGDGSQERRNGRPRELLTLNPSAGAAIGVDFSAGQVRVLLANLAHEIIVEELRPLEKAWDWHERLDVACELVGRATDQVGANPSRLVGIGLGIPDPIDLASGAVGASGTSGWAGVHAADEMSRRLQLPVAMDNTVHLASLAEVMWGAGAGARNVVYLRLSNGVGAGLMIDGRIFRGSIGAAGEIGHVSVDPAGPACRCGNRGCLELYAGISAVLTSLRDARGHDITVERMLEDARAGERATCRVLEDAAQIIGLVAANAANLVNPERVVVGGRLAEAGDAVLGPLRTSIERHALPIVASACEVVPAQLGDRAGALGGVALVLSESERLSTAGLSA